MNSLVTSIRLAAIVLFIGVAFDGSAARAEQDPNTPSGSLPTTLASPDGRLVLSVQLATAGDSATLSYGVSRDGRTILDDSSITLMRDDGVAIGQHLTAVKVGQSRLSKSEWEPVYGERSAVVDHYRELVIRSYDTKAACNVTHTFRCYDAGVAFKTRIESDKPSIRITEEVSEFQFTHNAHAWRTTDAQGEYDKVALSDLGDNVERPLVVELEDSTHVAIAEANLVNYARMNLRGSDQDPHCLVSHLASGVVAEGQLETPWRVVMVADTPGALLENNDLFLNLSDECQIADTSWIKPGKVLREITLTTAGGLAAVDFAVEHDFDYIEFDAGWYGHEYDDSSDATTITLDSKRSAGPFDLHRMIEYASSKGIGVIVYVNRRALETQLDEILPLYKSWGLKGVKYGFVQVGSQKWTAWLHDAVQKAAENELMVIIHDQYRPTGFSRTYPNLVNQEGVRGDEASPSAEQALITLFTRCVAGATDFTICYYDDRVDELWTHAHQLAKSVCFYGPTQFIFWYDTPLGEEENPSGKREILPMPELEFFKDVPSVWDDTKVIHGKIGEYAVIARRSGDDWFIGALNNGEARTLEAPLSFLDEGRQYNASIYSDDASVDTVTRVRIERKTLNHGDVLSIPMVANGGQAVRLTPAAP